MRTKECHIIPEEEKQCVWMTTGLISYKLCTRDFRCEECIFDQVMRDETAVPGRMPAPEAPPVAPPLSTPASSVPVTGALFYHQSHCWAKVEDPEEVRVGINGILAKMVARIKAVVLPRAGGPVVQGQCFAHIIQEKHIVPLISPLTGTVLAANDRLNKSPDLLLSDSLEQGWVVTVRPDNLEHDLRTLLFGKRAIEWYHKREQEICEASSAVLNPANSELGMTLQDGGERIGSLAETLTSEQYYQILESVSRPEDPV